MTVDEAFEWYTERQDQIVEGHIGEYIAIADFKVLGFYKDIEGTIDATAAYEPEKFMIKKCKPKGKDVIHFYNSMVRFA